ncbi:MAG: radical SAM protein [Treponema sp.]|nr:radical SAM protein [Treponema sp.]
MTRRRFLKVCLAAMGLTACGAWGSRRGSSGSQDDADTTPSYIALAAQGELERREEQLWEKMEHCDLCPRNCGVNRLAGEKGFCSSDDTFKVATHGPHWAEELVISGRGGTGTIFFSDCNFLCAFCKNWQISHRGDGRVTSHEELASMFLTLERSGCHNINLETPTHLVPHIIRALRIAVPQGLSIPLVYNSSGYESLETLRLLDGIIDIYLPDFKFFDSSWASTLSQGAPDYVHHTSLAIKEMLRQVGHLQQARGIAFRGLLVRHLVMPQNTAGTGDFVRWVAEELGPETHVNIMGEYAPQHMARDFSPLERRPSAEDFHWAMQWARDAGLRNFH